MVEIEIHYLTYAIKGGNGEAKAGFWRSCSTLGLLGFAHRRRPEGTVGAQWLR
jgi:hypothetical protein